MPDNLPSREELTKRILQLETTLFELKQGKNETLRMQAEESLQKSEDKYRGIIEKANEVIAITQDGMIKFINSKSSEISGYSPQEFISKSFIDFVHPDDQSMVMQHHIKRLAGEEIPGKYELRFVTKNGTVIWVENHGVIIEWEGKPATLNFFTDITDRKQTEKTLKASEEKFRILFQDHMVVKLIIDPCSGNIVGANKAAEDFYGWTIEQLKKMQIQEINLLAPQQVMAEMEKARCRECNHFELHHRLSDGSIRHVEVYSSTVKTNGKEFLHSIIIDISERKRMETRLAIAKQQWEETFDAVWDWIFITDDHFKILRSNKASKEFVNLSAKQIVGRTCYDIVHGKDCPIPDCPHSRCEKKQHRESMEFQMADGRWLLVSVDPMKTQNGDGLFVHMLRDITELKNKENEILSARKAEAFSTLSGGIAHDYNNLLTVIWGNISLLKEGIADAGQLACCQDAERACEQARDLTHQFITLSKGARFEKEFYPIEEILSAAIKKFKDPKAVDILVNIQGGIPAILADQDQLTIAFRNIIQNSLEATAHGGHVEIQVKMDVFSSRDQNDKCLKVSFKDTGKGMSEFNLLNSFDPYYTTKGMGNQKGSGLGLAVSMAIIKKHGGNIQIHSKVGRGTTLVVSLPLPDLDANRQSDLNDVVSPEKPTILFMEDDLSISKLCGKMLQRLNCKVIPAACSTETIEKYLAAVNDNIKIDLILLDQNIKEGIGGIETLKELRKCGYDNEALVITGSPSSPAILDFKKYGFDGRLLKPYTKRELKEVINQFVVI